jgi:predicted nucleic acid-binding protein
VKPALIDTSVWRRYFAGRTKKRETDAMNALLGDGGEILTHTMVIGELLLGGLAFREEELMRRLPLAPEVASDELLSFIRHCSLSRRGIGWVDVHLLASARVASATLWSFDDRLTEVADELAVAFVPGPTVAD